MKKKIFAAIVAGAMVVSTLVGCGQTEAPATNNDTTTDAVVEEDTTATDEVVEDETPAPVEEVIDESASIDFEDGAFAFVGNDTKSVGGTKDAAFSVVDYNGSKALRVDPAGLSNVAFQMDALLGDNAGKVAKIAATIGVEDATLIDAASGVLVTSMDGSAIDKEKWSVYMSNKNPKRFEMTVSDGVSFADGALFSIAVTDDVAIGAKGAAQPYFIDNVAFFDADGNVLPVDTSAEYSVVAGDDPNLLKLADVVELDGFAVSAGGWAQAGIDLTEEQKALFVPGSVIEIEYSCADGPVWLVAICAGDNPNPMGGWLRGINQDTFVPNAYVSNGKIQYRYEDLVEFFGEDYGQFLDTLQCEGKADWEVYSVKVGKASGSYPLAGTELEGFAVSAGGWAQAGIDLTEEQKALFVPGSVVEIEYSCADGPVWLVAICGDENPNPLGGWLRGIDQNTFEPENAAVDGKITYTYEQLVPYFGEDFGQYLNTLQCEGKGDWEVYSVKVGKPVLPMKNATELEGFAVSAGGWAQAGIELTAEQKALFVPGALINIEYACADGDVWLVGICNSDNPNPMGGWLRGVNQDTFVVDGAVSDGMVQYTYEELVPYFGEDYGQFLDTLQCEGKGDWEVYSVTVGQR